MKIGIIGGTGGMGRGFALRWCKKNDITVGSRDVSRAEESAREYTEIARKAYGEIEGRISGKDNAAAAKESDVLILAIPYEKIESTCTQILPEVKSDCVIVSPIVPMVKTETGFEFIPIKDGRPSSHELVSRCMEKGSLVSAFHVISEKKMVDPKVKLDYDIFVCGDDKRAVDIVNGLIGEIAGLRPVYLGGGALAYMAEIATPLLLNAMIRNRMKNPGIKIV